MFIVVAFTAKGSAEEFIKKELQAVAEGVAASVFQSSTPSNPDIPAEVNASGYEGNQDTDVSTSDIEMQHKAKFEVCNLRSLHSLSVSSLSSPPSPLPSFICGCLLQMHLSSCLSCYFS